MTTEKEDDAQQLSVRVDEALRQQLVSAARRSVRSLNGEILSRLRSTFDQQDTAAA
jgi:hypothetical protein